MHDEGDEQQENHFALERSHNSRRHASHSAGSRGASEALPETREGAWQWLQSTCHIKLLLLYPGKELEIAHN